MKEEIQALSLTDKHELISRFFQSHYEINSTEIYPMVAYLTNQWDESFFIDVKDFTSADKHILSLVYGD